MTTSIDLRAEWRQLFDDTWRLYRDFFHAPIHPLSGWTAVRRKYAAVLAHCTSRDDVNDTIAEMIGETSVGHAYIGSEGDAGTTPPAKPTGMLGADFALERGAFRITRVYEGSPVDDGARSPLRTAGVREGDYLLAVNGVSLDVTRDPRAAFAGLANTNVTITVGPNPQRDALARDVVVTPLADEFNSAIAHGSRRIAPRLKSAVVDASATCISTPSRRTATASSFASSPGRSRRRR